jgi:hypothetical protein
MVKTIPFTYLIKHIPTDKYYYGVMYRKGCNPNDFWTKYFTSSKKVKSLIKRYGKKSFIFEIRKTFKKAEQALNWEHKVLRRMKVIHKNNFLNLTDNKSIDPKHLSKIMMGKRMGKDNPMYGKKHTIKSIKKMSLATIGKNNPMYGKKGKYSHMYGKKHKAESIKKIKLSKLAYWKEVKKNKIDLFCKSL